MCLSVIQYYSHFIQTDPFHLGCTLEIDIEKILGSTNFCKAAGIDDLSDHFLKDGSRVLSKPISELCNLSIKLGRFPNSCKIAKLKPLFKKGPNINSNYRSISLLTLISKIIEKLMHKQTSSFISNNEILYSYKSRFWKNHLIDSCSTFLHDKILMGFDKGLMTGMMLIELQKTFDMIDHDILLKKLNAIGFSNHTIDWF